MSASVPNPTKDPVLRVQTVIGTQRKHWQIVNALGGLVEYFEGTKAQAEKRARDLQLDRAILSKAVAARFSDESIGE